MPKTSQDHLNHQDIRSFTKQSCCFPQCILHVGSRKSSPRSKCYIHSVRRRIAQVLLSMTRCRDGKKNKFYMLASHFVERTKRPHHVGKIVTPNASCYPPNTKKMQRWDNEEERVHVALMKILKNAFSHSIVQYYPGLWFLEFYFCDYWGQFKHREFVEIAKIRKYSLCC